MYGTVKHSHGCVRFIFSYWEDTSYTTQHILNPNPHFAVLFLILLYYHIHQHSFFPYTFFFAKMIHSSAVDFKKQPLHKEFSVFYWTRKGQVIPLWLWQEIWQLFREDEDHINTVLHLSLIVFFPCTPHLSSDILSWFISFTFFYLLNTECSANISIRFFWG